MTSFHQTWTQIFSVQHAQCVRRPPAVPSGTLTPAAVTAYKQVIDPFHRVWGSWWIWIGSFPMLLLLIIAQRCGAFLRGIVSFASMKAHYLSELAETKKTAKLLAWFHMLIRGLFMPVDIAIYTNALL